MSGEGLGQPNAENIARAEAFMKTLGEEHPDTSAGDTGGSSENFKKTAEAWQKVGEELYGKMGTTALAALAARDIRDGRDLGEMLHEQASWEDQIERESQKIGEYILSSDEALKDKSLLSGRDPITGEEVEDSSFAKIEDGQQAVWAREAFLNLLGDDVGNGNGVPSQVGYGFDALVYLAAGKDAPVVDSKDRTERALRARMAERFMAQAQKDEEGMEALQESPTYRIIQRMVEIWKKGKEYTPVSEGDQSDARGTNLYKRVDALLGTPVVDRPFGEE